MVVQGANSRDFATVVHRSASGKVWSAKPGFRSADEGLLVDQTTRFTTPPSNSSQLQAIEDLEKNLTVLMLFPIIFPIIEDLLLYLLLNESMEENPSLLKFPFIKDTGGIYGEKSFESLTTKLNIDCGATDADIIWEMDDKFIKSGQKMLINTTITLQEMTTLRYFPHGTKNCYNLALQSPGRYLMRAGFYYGNYDGLSKPPAFDLHINVQYWTTVKSTLSDDPIYVEMIYPIKRDKVKICLVRIDNDYKFISSLEAKIIPRDFYRLMDNHTFLNLIAEFTSVVTTMLGNLSTHPLKKKSEKFGFNEDFTRIWKLKQMQDYYNVTSVRIPLGVSSSTENWPPYMVVADAIGPPNGFSISMSLDLGPRVSQAYFVFYFKEPDQWGHWPPEDRIRKVQISIDDQQMAITDVPRFDRDAIRVVSLYPVPVAGSANVTLESAEGSALPPIINAMEVFTSVELSRAEPAHHCSFMVLALLHVLGLSMLFG
ncbi:probable LRR receptor-like serine/threonine-protein kinase At1g51880 [Cornus florida]|uniref:probable LRR receptor-like serine/threonine-protein kinase At1g51880 n=1 Tax=Cornus florida TaxID=4283 RepID=UPI002898E73F|nr:probable LRR receptor-like serine/threonine-protein kinase At1g51880 [Cornus florida]